MKHELKTWPEYFEPISVRLKKFEARVNDRNFKLGDLLHLREWEPSKKEYTGRELVAEVTYIMDAGRFFLKPNTCIMSIEVVHEMYSTPPTASPATAGLNGGSEL